MCRAAPSRRRRLTPSGGGQRAGRGAAFLPAFPVDGCTGIRPADLRRGAGTLDAFPGAGQRRSRNGPVPVRREPRTRFRFAGGQTRRLLVDATEQRRDQQQQGVRVPATATAIWSRRAASSSARPMRRAYHWWSIRPPGPRGRFRSSTTPTVVRATGGAVQRRQAARAVRRPRVAHADLPLSGRGAVLH